MADDASVLVDASGTALELPLFARALSFLSFLFRNLKGSKQCVKNSHDEESGQQGRLPQLTLLGSMRDWCTSSAFDRCLSMLRLLVVARVQRPTRQGGAQYTCQACADLRKNQHDVSRAGWDDKPRSQSRSSSS